MNPWQLLEIETTATSKEVKYAYSKKLKVTKPSEKPVEFQALHQAYKAALNFANGQEGKVAGISADSLIHTAAETEHLDSNDESIQDEQVSEITQEAIPQIIETSQQPVQEEINVELKRRQDDYQRLILEVENLLKSKNSSMSGDEQTWHFLANSPYILEDDFNTQLGRHVFYLLTKYGKTRVRRRSSGSYYKRQMPRTVIHYCDQVFSWRIKAYYLAHEFGQEFCRLIFSKLDENHNLNNSTRGVRGGTIVLESKDSQTAQGTRPTQPSPPSKESNTGKTYGGPSPFFIVLLLLGVMHLLRNCSPHTGG